MACVVGDMGVMPVCSLGILICRPLLASSIRLPTCARTGRGRRVGGWVRACVACVEWRLRAPPPPHPHNPGRRRHPRARPALLLVLAVRGQPGCAPGGGGRPRIYAHRHRMTMRTHAPRAATPAWTATAGTADPASAWRMGTWGGCPPPCRSCWARLRGPAWREMTHPPSLRRLDPRASATPGRPAFIGSSRGLPGRCRPVGPSPAEPARTHLSPRLAQMVGQHPRQSQQPPWRPPPRARLLGQPWGSRAERWRRSTGSAITDPRTESLQQGAAARRNAEGRGGSRGRAGVEYDLVLPDVFSLWQQPSPNVPVCAGAAPASSHVTSCAGGGPGRERRSPARPGAVAELAPALLLLLLQQQR